MSRPTSSLSKQTKSTLFLFTRDLRLEDHAGLAEAVRHGDVIPALVLDPAARERLARSPKRAVFFCGAVRRLSMELAARGSSLIVRSGPLAATATRLARELHVEAVVWTWAYDAPTVERQRTLQSSLEEAGLRAVGVHDAPAVAPDDTAASRAVGGGLGYRAFAPYDAAWRRSPRAPYLLRDLRLAAPAVPSELLPAPSDFGAPDLETPLPTPEAKLAQFIESPALQYGTMRHVPAVGGTSGLAADLSFGTIAARTVLARVDERCKDPFLLTEEGLSLRAFTRSLAQRDFFFQLAWLFERRPDEPLQASMRDFAFAKSHPALDAWRHGRTGYPLVDAGMRELRATGWMHPHVRFVTASFLCFDLGVDWRIGRDEWDRHLIEDDPALATGNWQWVAGVGADLVQFPRIFNPIKQARRFDPLGTYVRRWIPELRMFSDADVLDPLGAGRRAQMTLPFFAGETYPAPVIDHSQAARAFLRRFAGHVQRSAPQRP